MALSGIGAIDAVRAQQAATPSPFQPIETPTLNPEMLKTPQPSPHAGADGTNFDKSSKEQPGLKLPNRVDIGKYELQFKTGRTRDITTREGIDSGETSNLSATIPGQKQNQPLPDYFGLKLSAPTH